ncbi:MAG: hypothetical protein PHY48_07760 [Candidatus Cloacimonetes bacterium]|nr:hypothetical protein [Candidatus Cloacimonadota bacterium]
MHFETFEKYQEFDLIKQKYAVANTNALSALSEISDGFFEFIISTFYYNTGKSYEIKTSIDNYPNTQEEIISQ